MSPIPKALLLRSALNHVPILLPRAALRPLSTLPLTRAMVLRAPPVASVVVGTATAIVTEKIASKLVDKVADEAATKTVETAKTAVAAVTGLDLESEDQGESAARGMDVKTPSASTTHTKTPSAPKSSAPNGQHRTITTRTSTKVTPQKAGQPYDYKPISDLDSIADAIGPESAHDAREDMRSAAGESATKAATDRHLEAAHTSPRGTEETQQLKETVRGFAGSVVQDHKDMWQDTKHEWNETMDVGKGLIKDTAQSIKGTVGKVLGAGMGDATKVADNAESLFTSGADVVGNTDKDQARSAAETVEDAYAGAQDKAKDASAEAGDTIMDAYASAKGKATDAADKASDMYSHAADRAQDALSASRAKTAHVTRSAKDTAAGMADSARAMGHEVVDKTKAKAHEVQDRVAEVKDLGIDTAKTAADHAQESFNEAKAGVKGAAAGYDAGKAAKSAIEQAKDAAKGASAPVAGTLAGLDDLPVGHSMNDYLDEAEDLLRGGDVRRRSKL